jgi:arylsulfatase A-like enzyme
VKAICSPARPRPAALLLVAAWFGLLTGLAEVSILASQKLFLHRILHVSPHAAWMAPVADLVVFAAPGLALSVLVWRRPELASPRAAASILAFLGFLSLLLLFPSLHWVAALLLAAGLALPSGRFVAARPADFRRLVRRTTGWLALLVVGLAAGVYGWRAWTERWALAALPPAPAGAPNVLLIVLDTVRAQNLSLHGYDRRTSPELERLAASGVRFERALSSAPWTLPSHASMFTGRFPHELSTGWFTPLDATYATLAEVLSAHGYDTAGFVANTIYASYEHGLDRGFARYEDYPLSPAQVLLSSSLGRKLTNIGWLRRLVHNHQILGRKDAPEVNRDFLRWLSRERKRPFFAFLNYLDAHEPYLPPAPFEDRFGPARPRRNSLIVNRTNSAERSEKWKMSPEEVQAEILAYDASIAYLDSHLGRLFGELRARGMLDHTLLIVTSDHGEEFGEHGVFSHGNSLYWPSLHVPLLISFPGRVPAGRVVREPVSLRDLPATVVDLAGLRGATHFPGSSLARHWPGASAPGTHDGGAVPGVTPPLAEVGPGIGVPERYPISKGPMQSLVAEGRHYIRNGDGREELYDLESDPWESRDLAGSAEDRSTLDRFRTDLARVLGDDR